MKQNGEFRNRFIKIWITYFWQKCKCNPVEKRYSFQQMVLEQLDTKNELGPISCSICKHYPKYVTELKLLENVGEKSL